MAPVALIDVDPLDLAAGQGLGFFQHLLQGVAIVGIAGQGLGVEDELTALGSFVGRRKRDLDAELVRRSCLALADALDLWRMPGIEFPAPLALLLAADLAGPEEGNGEDLVEVFVVANSAPEIANEPAEPGPQELDPRSCA